jgi:cell division protein FtsI/penicillin-binding protein 2
MMTFPLPSLVPSRPLSRWFVPWLIWGCVAGGANFSAWKIVDHSLATPAPVDEETALWTLPRALHGANLSVPEGAGLWLSEIGTDRASVLVRRVWPVGLAQEINLCLQLKNRADAPKQIYPIALAGDWADVRAARKSENSSTALRVQHSPLVVAPALALGMPRLVVSGDYPGRLLAQITPGPQTGRWALAFAEATGNAYILGDETWLLWQPARAQEVPADNGFSHAVRIRRLPAMPMDKKGCRESTEMLEWQLFTGSGVANEPRALSPLAEVSIQTKETALARLRLPPGEHTVPAVDRSPMEDKALFDRALALGLIRLGNDQQIEWAPVDLERAAAAGLSIPGWEKVQIADPAVRRTHKGLHRSANGQFVRSQLLHFNARRQWLAVRVRAASATGAVSEWGDLRYWQAESKSQILNLANDLPAVASRLFATLPVGWSPWVRVASWPLALADRDAAANAPVRLTLAPPPGARPGQRIDVLALGRLLGVDGGRIVASEAVCQTTACPAPEVLTQVRIELGAGQLILTLAPELRFNQLRPAAAEFARVQLRQGKLVWMEPPKGFAPATPAEVTILARDGTPLFAQGRLTAMASELGVGELIGLDASQPAGVFGMLGRLGRHGRSTTVATLSLEPKLQTLADQVLECVGQHEATWDVRAARCNDSTDGVTKIPSRRIASLVMMDAENGEILAVSGTPHAPPGVSAAELNAFDRFNAGASLLRIHAWQHNGDNRYSPGSTFKLIDALMIEMWAAGNPERQELLEGQSPEQWNALGSPLGFNMSANCYPLPCDKEKIDNFGKKPTLNNLKEGRFGLVQALEKSVNTWFAWMVERSDATAVLAPTIHPLGEKGLEEARPLLAMANRLGFEHVRRLDGGLLPADFAWQSEDPLQTVASRFDPILDTHNIRLQAIGQRMQVTPLQMAEVAAAIATGRVVTPRLLIGLDGRQATNMAAPELGVELARIHRGMKAVVDSGTAAQAFSGAAFVGIRPGVYGKTGTADMVTSASDGENGTAGHPKLKVVWFVGYLQPGTLPGQRRPVAFAVSISHSPLLGGAHAAKVIAALLETLHAKGEVEPAA